MTFRFSPSPSVLLPTSLDHMHCLLYCGRADVLIRKSPLCFFTVHSEVDRSAVFGFKVRNVLHCAQTAGAKTRGERNNSEAVFTHTRFYYKAEYCTMSIPMMFWLQFHIIPCLRFFIPLLLWAFCKMCLLCLPSFEEAGRPATHSLIAIFPLGERNSRRRVEVAPA